MGADSSPAGKIVNPCPVEYIRYLIIETFRTANFVCWNYLSSWPRSKLPKNMHNGRQVTGVLWLRIVWSVIRKGHAKRILFGFLDWPMTWIIKLSSSASVQYTPSTDFCPSSGATMVRLATNWTIVIRHPKNKRWLNWRTSRPRRRDIIELFGKRQIDGEFGFARRKNNITADHEKEFNADKTVFGKFGNAGNVVHAGQFPVCNAIVQIVKTEDTDGCKKTSVIQQGLCGACAAPRVKLLNEFAKTVKICMNAFKMPPCNLSAYTTKSPWPENFPCYNLGICYIELYFWYSSIAGRRRLLRNLWFRTFKPEHYTTQCRRLRTPVGTLARWSPPIFAFS